MTQPVQPLVIFDFDGTLADSLAYSTAIIQRIAPQFRLQLPTDLQAAREKPTRELFREMGLSWWKLPRVIRAFQAEAVKGAGSLSLFADWPQVLAELGRVGIRLGVLSSNREDAIRACLRANGVESAFAFVEGYPRLFGKGKALRRILRRERLGREWVAYVGDETRDLDAARSAGVVSIGVPWGYHSRTLLATASPDHVAESPRDVLRLVCETIFPFRGGGSILP